MSDTNKQPPSPEEILSDNINRIYYPYIDDWIEDNDPKATTVIDVMKEYAKEVVQYTLQQAAEKANLLGEGVRRPITDTQDTVYVSDSNGLDFMYKVNQESILSLEEEIIKTLKL